MPTKIEWTDETWNFINGCSIVSPGCTNCYAMRWAHRMQFNPNEAIAESRRGLTKVVNGKPVWTGEILMNRALATRPLEWRKPRRIFVNAHGDLFHADVPDAWVDYVFAIALLCPQHTFQILTKRPERMREYMQMVLDESEEAMTARFAMALVHGNLALHPAAQKADWHWPPRNCWLGTSVEDQTRADERIPILLDTPAAIRWLSCEPLLGPVDIQPWLDPCTPACMAPYDFNPEIGIDWVIAGGESGPGARPMHPSWPLSLRDQCAAAGVPFFFKQWGDWTPNDYDAKDSSEGAFVSPDGTLVGGGAEKVAEANCEKPCRLMFRLGKGAAGRWLNGRTYDEYPEVVNA